MKVINEINKLFREPRTEKEKEEIARNTAAIWLKLKPRDYILSKEKERIEKEIKKAKEGKWSKKKLERNVNMLHRIFEIIKNRRQENGKNN